MAQHFASLCASISPSITAFPPLLQEQAERQWQRLVELAPDYGGLPESVRQTLLTLLGLSDFVADSLFKQPELLAELIASGDLQQAERWPAYQQDLTALLAEVSDEEAL
ncbi:MAG: bifunctional [glutamate--ammonia ligase]-adenylyl-L-tyrosine phosphorylase/[glutamate--ammonia-ligase] adenylyltransferase, partial [Aeromonas sobria]